MKRENIKLIILRVEDKSLTADEMKALDIAVGNWAAKTNYRAIILDKRIDTVSRKELRKILERTAESKG